MEPIKPHIFSASLGSPLGYDLKDSEKARQWAVQEGFNLVKLARHAGLETRSLAQQVAVKCAALVSEARQTRCVPEFGDGSKEHQEIERKSRALQLEVAERLRSYLDELFQVMGRLQALNPPLNSEQLQPFVDAALADRQTTLSSLDPFARMMDLLRRWSSPDYNADQTARLGLTLHFHLQVNHL